MRHRRNTSLSRSLPFAVLAAGGLCSLAQAHEVDAASDTVDQVVVVANRAPEPLAKVGQSVTVITADDIRSQQTPIVSDILARTPGVSLARNGGVGQTTSLYIRGAETDQTLVRIDGVKLNDPSSTGGGYNLADLLVGDIDRIEILRGSQSTLYGSQAIGGVIDITTARATRPLQADVQVEGGTYGTFSAKAAAAGHDGALTWRLAATDYSTTGISAFDKRFGGREADGYRNQGASGSVNYAFTPDVSLDLKGLYLQSRAKFDGFSTPTFTFGDDSEFGATREALAYAGLNVAVLDGRLKNRLALQFTNTQRDFYDPADAPVEKTFDGRGANARLEYQGVAELAPGWRGVFGAEHERSSIATSSPAFDDPGTPPLKAHTTLDSGYGQLQGEVLPGLNLTAGLRYDDHSTFGSHVTGQAAAAWSPDEGVTTLRASYGSGFKAPSLYQLYSPYGNAGLKPEEADGWDAGIQRRFWAGKVDLQATYFHRDTDNLIDFASCFGAQKSPRCATQPDGFYDNIARSTGQGVELTGSVQPLAGLEITGNYTYADAQNRARGSADFGRDLGRRPKDLANLGADYAWPFKLTTGISVRYAGASFDDAANTVRLKSYTLVDVRASYPLAKGLELYGRIENLTDQAYETAYSYGSLGRAGYVGLRVSY